MRIRIVWGIRTERILLMVWLEGLVVRLGAKNFLKGSVHIYIEYIKIGHSTERIDLSRLSR